MIISFCVGFYLGGAAVEAATDYFSGIPGTAKDRVVAGAIWPYTLGAAAFRRIF